MALFRKNKIKVRVLAIVPTSRGFGYAVMEGPKRLIDWGLKESGHYDQRWCLRHLIALLRLTQPQLLLVPEVVHSQRKRELLAAMNWEADALSVQAETVANQRQETA